jgi:hypothetical protein
MKIDGVTFLITFGKPVKFNYQYVKGSFFRFALGPVAFWFIQRDFEYWIVEIDEKIHG